MRRVKVKIKSKCLNDNAKRVATAEKLVHVRRAKKFYDKLSALTKLCQEDPKVGGIVIDYMQNLQMPQIPVQETFY
ncbi:unnamed protein product [Pieris macdunnoughi]|uniref:Uncharacterized protein n=1 Tax=Pieris macdunnoughi TaxID=345717 RepID=A0A821UFX8_9NEOP|nr:unnamed protein product [Pieris macdunnoughi]